MRQRGLPQQKPELVRLMAERWFRAQEAQAKWSATAKECVNFIEGKQWTDEQIAQLKAEGRPALVFNEIAPLYRLILGYHRNNRMDTNFLPGHDGSGAQHVAEALSHLWKQFSEQSRIPYVDAEVFADGISTGRGYYDTRMDFDENDFGEARSTALDPFSVYPDPDADGYDSKTWGFVNVSRWASLDEIEHTYGPSAAKLIGNLTRGDGYVDFPQQYYHTNDEITPIRKFGHEEGDNTEYWSWFHDRWYDFIDTARKNIRIVDSQYWITQQKNVFIDLETGDRQVVPDHWDEQRVQKVLYHAERVNNPLVVRRRPVKRCRWTVMVGDLLVHDDWSPYDHFTIDGFFPYFRRGQTRGMVHDLLDPQREKNKRRSAEIDIVGRTTNSGWLYHENSLDPDQETKLDKYGSSPGIRIKWKGKPAEKPERINPSPPPTAMERLEQKASDDLRRISGVNESALGELDRVQSGRAIEARQRQAVLSFQMYLDNFSRTKEQLGYKWLNLVQKHYTEPRIVRVLGEDDQMITTAINQPVLDEQGNVLERLNDITLGKYSVIVDEVPMTASFQNAQFEEAMELVDKLGPLLGPAAAGLGEAAVELSSMPSTAKEKVKQHLAMQTALATGGVPMDPAAGGGPALLPAPSLDDNVVPMPQVG